MRLKSFLITLLMLFSVVTYADDAEQTLKQFLSTLHQMSGEFTQIIVSERGSTIRSASGTFKVKKPGLFDWQYKQPYEQQIVSNGQKIWIYDEDLEQVSIRQISESLNSSPLSIFVSDTPVDNIFDIKSIGTKEDADWVRLTPKTVDSSFEYIDIGFHHGQLSNMVLQDNFGQTTRLLFTNISKNTPIDDADFEFIVPEGSDVFEE
ncbi:MAG: outer membrane lipoprotein carrier protein LolA [Piscirickettsiaceae bacterium]|nr:MAG: outer membrane lipoprotein carrier protein LolA [Piscirickettsiaceae bacterium]